MVSSEVLVLPVRLKEYNAAFPVMHVYLPEGTHRHAWAHGSSPTTDLEKMNSFLERHRNKLWVISVTITTTNEQSLRIVWMHLEKVEWKVTRPLIHVQRCTKMGLFEWAKDCGMKGKVSDIKYSFWQLGSEKRSTEGLRTQASPPLQKRSKAGFRTHVAFGESPFLGFLVELESLIDRPCSPVAAYCRDHKLCTCLWIAAGFRWLVERS